ncbi:hypothetical protein MKX01_039066, partial [Papaver californicum]
ACLAAVKGALSYRVHGPIQAQKSKQINGPFQKNNILILDHIHLSIKVANQMAKKKVAYHDFLLACITT